MLLRFKNDFEDFDLKICKDFNLKVCERFNFKEKYNVLRIERSNNNKTLFRIQLLIDRRYNAKKNYRNL